jgi:L-lactate dehydrogenase complex protein LldF
VSVTVPLKQFQQDADRAVRLDQRRGFIREALHGYEATRAQTESAFTDWQRARTAAADIKWRAIENLDKHLEAFADKLEARGVKVFWAGTGEEAVEYIRAVMRENDAKSVVKSKTMTSEEIHLNEALEADGYHVVESDLGEYIVQLRKEAPYHIVFPAMHLKRGEIRDTFDAALGDIETDDPEQLTLIARRVLRQKYLQADIGISGANFGVAETGMISITENEGNARLTTSMPKVHIALMGIEKIVPKLDDLALLLPMLATAGTGQHLTCYNTVLGGPRQKGEPDGPEQMHVVLLDNGRTSLLADPEQRDALRCIRCGACLNACPVFKNVGGFAYGTTYQGPIGSVITPHLRGLKDWAHLSTASSLCGACSETCPVRIDLHHHLLRNRRNAHKSHPKLAERLAFGVFSFVMTRPGLYRLAGLLRGVPNWLPKRLHGTRLDPARAWRISRTLPKASGPTFKQYWKGRGR